MGNVNSGIPTSRRGYLSQLELAQFADITITDPAEADDQISQAEEMIDAYVRFVKPYIDYDIIGKVTSGTTTKIIDTNGGSQFGQPKDYFKGLQIEIMGGLGAGERRTITGSDPADHSITFPAFTTAPDATSAYLIKQLGKFPREKDVYFNLNVYYKVIPEAVRRAVAAQVEYIIEKGASFFKGATDFASESMDDYSYQRTPGAQGVDALISPKARQLLKGFVVRTGRMIR